MSFLVETVAGVRQVYHCKWEEVQSLAYSPFGEMLSGKQAGFRYNAEWFDAATGMQHLHARQYEPAMMRFSQKDKQWGDATKPVSLNRYLFIVNDPVNLIVKRHIVVRRINYEDLENLFG